MELNFWQSTECQHAQFNEKTQEWTVKVARDGKEMVLRPKQLVLATGMSGVPISRKSEGPTLLRECYITQ